MAATNYTPIQLYHSTTASAVPVNTNLVNGELAINITDGKLYYKDNGGTVQVIASKGTGTIGGSTTQVQYNLSGALAGSSNFVFDGTTATINTLNLTNALGATYGGTAQSSWTTGDLLYASGSNTLAKLGIGLNTYILTSNGSIPGWAAPSAISVNTATNLAGGAAGSVPYQSGAGATTFLSIGTANQVVTSTGSAPQWSSGLSITTLTASDAVTFSATTQNIALGTSQTSGTFTVGGTAQTGNIAIDRSTKTHTLNIGTGITESGQTKTINIGTAGDTGSTTAITIGSANGTTITVNGTVNASTLDLTNLEVTNIKAKDGTAAIVLTDSTGAVAISTALTANGGAVFNENGANVDFRVEGDTDANLLFVDASADFVGIGTNAPVAKLSVSGAISIDASVSSLPTNGGVGRLTSNAFTYFTGLNSGGAGTVLNNGNGTSTIQLVRNDPSGAYIVFEAGNGAEKMRLTSTGTLNIVGAGTAGSTQAISFSGSAPIDSLVVAATTGNVGLGTSTTTNGRLSAQAGTAATGNSLFLANADGTYNPYLQIQHSSAGVKLFNSSSFGSPANNLIFGNGGVAETMRIDGSGNLGLGVTPSAWFASNKAFQIGSTGAVSNYTNGANIQTFLSNNVFWNAAGTISYITTNTATSYTQDNGAHKWYAAPSGFGVGTAATSLTSTQNGNSYTIVSAGNTDFTLIGAANNNVGTTFTKSGGTGTGTGTVSQTVPFTQAMTLDASGNLGVGITNPGFRVDFRVGSTGNIANFSDGTQNLTIGTASGSVSYVNGAAGVLGLYTSDTERARITSGGDLLVGKTTSGGQKLQVEHTANSLATVAVFKNSAATAANQYGIVSQFAGQPNNSSQYFLRCDDDNGNTERATIRSNGGLANYQSNNVDLSDARTKTDISPLGSYWNKIAGLEIVTYKYKDQTHDDLNIGVIAQQVEQVAPEFVDSDGFGDTPEDGVPLKTIYNKDLTFAAIKALQEAMARIETLEAKIAVLESKGA
jgi:hypothetical protein